MVPRRELITICRQIGTMMEVGVDFLRIIRALREQTENPRLLELYDQMEHDMRMGGNLADAIEKAPDVFSPFAVSLIRQGEARGDIEGAWHRLADFLKQEAQEDKDLGLEPVEERFSVQKRAVHPSQAEVALNSEKLVVVSQGAEKTVALLLGWSCALLFSLALVWWGVGLELVSPRWMVAVQLGLGAFFAGLAAASLTFSKTAPRASPTSQAQFPEQLGEATQQSSNFSTVDTDATKNDEEIAF